MEVELLPISAVIPTRDRSVSLRRMLHSLAEQSAQPFEMIVIDASTKDDTENLCKGEVPGLKNRIFYQKACRVGAAVQRNEAMQSASQKVIWFVDDDVTFEPECLARLWRALQGDPALGGVNAIIVNQKYSPPGMASRMLFQFLHGRKEASYAGKCIGPALNILPEDRDDLSEVVPVEWLNTTCTLYRKEALPEPLFSEQFQGYSMMEDVALSLVVGRKWKLANARTARIFHDSQGGDHKRDIAALAEMELVNRHYVMTQVLNRKKPGDYFKLAVLELFNLFSRLTSFDGWKSFPAEWVGKFKGMGRILRALR